MLEARSITFGYQKNQPLYQDFSLSVGPDERIALHAPSGTGKTTLCRILAGFEQPWSGEVLVDGAKLPARGVCPVQLIGQHPENAFDPRMRMADSLAEAGLRIDGSAKACGATGGATGSTDAADDATSATRATSGTVGTADAAYLLDALGIRDIWLRRFPHELSGGELQRFCIARALAAQPRYLIADEISTMLDAVTQAELWRFLLTEVDRLQIGLVLVTHAPALEARLATRVVSL